MRSIAWSRAWLRVAARAAAACWALLPLALLASGAILAPPVAAAVPSPCTHYAAPFESEGGRGPAGEPGATRAAGGTLEAPFTVADFWKRGFAKPGNVLCLKDGLYRGDHSMIRPKASEPLAGRPDAPIEVRALNDGKVWIDGEFQRSTLRVTHDYWTISGINAFNSVGPAVGVRGRKQVGEKDQEPVVGTVLRRIVAWRDFVPYGTTADYEALGGQNIHVFDIADAKDVLVEDCAGFGWGRKIFQVYRSQRVTLRRSWARWDGRYPYERSNKFAFSCSYKAYDTLCENLIATAGGSRDPAAMPPAYSPGLHLIATDGVAPGFRWIEPKGRDPHNLGLRILGSLAYLPPDARFSDVAGFHVGGSGYPHKGQKGVRIQNSVAWVPSGSKYAMQLQDCKDDPEKHPDGCAWSRQDDRSKAPVVVEKVTAAGGRKGAVRIAKDWRRQDVKVVSLDERPDIYTGASGGASLCHRTVDGRETSEPLWPWPMQDRIFAATERSNWETADVMGEITRLFGAPPPECTAR